MSTNINTNKNRPAYCVNRAKRKGTGSRGSTSSRAGKQRRQTDRHSPPSASSLAVEVAALWCMQNFMLIKLSTTTFALCFMSCSPLTSSLSLCLSICQPVSLWCPDISDKSLQKLPFDNFAKANKFLGFWLVVRTQWEILPNLRRFARWPLLPSPTPTYSVFHSISIAYF